MTAILVCSLFCPNQKAHYMVIKILSYEYTLIRVGHNFKFGILTFMIYRAGRSNLSITKKTCKQRLYQSLQVFCFIKSIKRYDVNKTVLWNIKASSYYAPL